MTGRTLTPEEAGDVAAGIILKALGKDSTARLAEAVMDAEPGVSGRDVYRELILMLVFAVSRSIQAAYPDRAAHGPIMDRMAAMVVSALISTPGAVDLGSATQSFRSEDDARAIADELKLDSPTESLVLARFPLWGQALQEFDGAQMLVFGKALGQALGVGEGVGLALVSVQVSALFMGAATAMADVLEYQGPSIGVPSEVTNSEETPLSRGCLYFWVAILLFFLGAFITYGLLS